MPSSDAAIATRAIINKSEDRARTGFRQLNWSFARAVIRSSREELLESCQLRCSP